MSDECECGIEQVTWDVTYLAFAFGLYLWEKPSIGLSVGSCDFVAWHHISIQCCAYNKNENFAKTDRN